MRTGGVRRNSYDLLLAERLGFAPTACRIGAPVVAADAIPRRGGGRRGVVGMAAAGGLAGVGAASTAGESASPSAGSAGLVDVEAGPTVAFVGALILGAGSVAASSSDGAQVIPQPNGEAETPVISTLHR